MTFTNGGGFVQAQTVVQADEFVSTNFSNANETGFDLNSGSTTDSFGTPANTAVFYNNIDITGGTLTATTIDAGTIVGGTISGTTITGATIVGGDIQSTNFSNTAQTGFDLNATNTTDTAGTPANTIQIYSAFYVGRATGGGPGISIGEISNQAQIQFDSSAPTETQRAGIYANPAGSNPADTTRSQLVINSNADADGTRTVALSFTPQTVKSGTPTQGQVTFGVSGNNGSGVTWPSGVEAILAVAQQYTTNIQNSNGVGGTAYVPLVIGVPGSTTSLRISTNELLAVLANGTSIGPLYINSNSAGTVFGALQNPQMRSIFARDATNTFTIPNNQTSFTVPGTTLCQVTYVLPQSSGQLVINHQGRIGSAGTGNFLRGDIFIHNVTQNTNPYGGSGVNCWQANPAGVGNSYSACIVVGDGGQGGFLGNAGDTLLISTCYSVSTTGTGSWTVGDATLTVRQDF